MPFINSAEFPLDKCLSLQVVFLLETNAYNYSTNQSGNTLNVRTLYGIRDSVTGDWDIEPYKNKYCNQN
jgi:hypothetical protein